MDNIFELDANKEMRRIQINITDYIKKKKEFGKHDIGASAMHFENNSGELSETS